VGFGWGRNDGEYGDRRLNGVEKWMEKEHYDI
jgi:hypothetical protein